MSVWALSKLCFCSYFEDDEEVNPEDLEYQPAPGSPSLDAGKGNASSDSEDDPLDAFMAGIEVKY